jgi:hypothetical protein
LQLLSISLEQQLIWSDATGFELTPNWSWKTRSAKLQTSGQSALRRPAACQTQRGRPNPTSCTSRGSACICLAVIAALPPLHLSCSEQVFASRAFLLFATLLATILTRPRLYPRQRTLDPDTVLILHPAFRLLFSKHDIRSHPAERLRPFPMTPRSPTT